MLRLGEVIGEVLRQLAGNNRHAALIGLLQAQILRHIQKTIRSYSRCNIKLAYGIGTYIHLRFVNIPPDFPPGVGIYYDLADGSSTLDLYNQPFLSLEHSAHHGRCGDGPSQSGYCCWGGLVPLLPFLYDLRCFGCKGANLPVPGSRPDQYVVHDTS
ncbi:hypothetical protein D3C81_1485880 [compost metagenome]